MNRIVSDQLRGLIEGPARIATNTGEAQAVEPRPDVPRYMGLAVVDGADIAPGDLVAFDDDGRCVRALPSTPQVRWAGFAVAAPIDGMVRVQVKGWGRVPARPRGITAVELRLRLAAYRRQPPLPLP